MVTKYYGTRLYWPLTWTTATKVSNGVVGIGVVSRMWVQIDLRGKGRVRVQVFWQDLQAIYAEQIGERTFRGIGDTTSSTCRSWDPMCPPTYLGIPVWELVRGGIQDCGDPIVACPTRAACLIAQVEDHCN